MFQDSFARPAQPLEILENLPFEFRLTGSRRFGTAHEDSNYDFYIQNSEEIRSALMTMGFRIVGQEDLDTYDIPGTDVFRKGNVDVQLRKVKEFELFDRANQVLDKTPGLYERFFNNKYYNPAARKLFWSFLIAACVPIQETQT